MSSRRAGHRKTIDSDRYDCGSKQGFLQATEDLDREHGEVGTDFAAWMQIRELA